ncbi:MAG: DUF86 domain-containing protein [Deltaproteobacteria bacterium]|jgi:uncharacterized protein YutE (UPF0331/DUF86 family)|nr:DUF86 domain-containing protein [Deltaproteobacteria bacterium]
MKFQEYLQRTIDVATVEKNVLDQLCELLATGKKLDQIQIRAAKSALQVLIENTIGKGKQILKHFQCPMVFHKGKEVFWVLTESGVIEENLQRILTQSIGFRNSMIHDYLNFDEKILVDILISEQHLIIYNFLIAPVELDETQKKRISTFTY